MNPPIPGTTPIPAEIHKKLLQQNDKLMSIQQSMQMFQQQCEARIAQVSAETRAAWQEVEKLGIDVRNIVWEPHPNEPAIVPRQMRFKE